MRSAVDLVMCLVDHSGGVGTLVNGFDGVYGEYGVC